MVDTIRTELDLLTNVFQDGQAPGEIDPQDIRDFVVSVKTLNPELIIAQPNPTHKEGLMFYDAEHKCPSYYNESPDVTVNIGQEMVIRVANNTGGDIEDGSVVHISGAADHFAEITKTIASDATPTVIGVSTQLIADGEIGYITSAGSVHGVNTVGLNVGDTLYVSDSVAGEWTVTAPTLPVETVIVGSVVEVGAEGHILVHPVKVSYSTETTAFGNLSHTVRQTAAAINTAYPVNFDTNTEVENITHSTTVDNEEITISIPGAYEFTVSYQLFQDGVGDSTILTWVQLDTGSGFADIDNSASTQDLGNAETRVLVYNHVRRYDIGDKIRFMWATTNTDGVLEAFAAGVAPAVPSAVVTLKKIGNV